MTKIRLFLILFLGMLLWGLLPVEAAPGDSTADAVLGQGNFNSNLPHAGGTVSATGSNWPYRIAVENQSGRLYTADYSNNRVLSWPKVEAFTNGAAADKVIGQPPPLD
jgi:hypothetical protein